MSTLIQQAEVTRAERDVLHAYLLPVYPQAAAEVETNPVVRRCVMEFAACLLAQRSIAATRTGAKTKTSDKSSTPTADDIRQQYAYDCHAALEDVRALEGANAKAKVRDICNIYFETNFFHA